MSLDEVLADGFRIYDLMQHPSEWWAILHRNCQWYRGVGLTYQDALLDASIATPYDVTDRQHDSLIDAPASTFNLASALANLQSKPTEPLFKRKL